MILITMYFHIINNIRPMHWLILTKWPQLISSLQMLKKIISNAKYQVFFSYGLSYIYTVDICGNMVLVIFLVVMLFQLCLFSFLIQSFDIMKSFSNLQVLVRKIFFSGWLPKLGQQRFFAFLKYKCVQSSFVIWIYTLKLLIPQNKQTLVIVPFFHAGSKGKFVAEVRFLSLWTCFFTFVVELLT